MDARRAPLHPVDPSTLLTLLTLRDETIRFQLATTLDGAVSQHARSVLATVLLPEAMDDRFDSWPGPNPNDRQAVAHNNFIGVTATDDGRPVGFVGGIAEKGGLRLDLLVAPSLPDPSIAGATLLHTILSPDSPDVAQLSHLGVDAIEIWGRPSFGWHDDVVERFGFSPHRELHQMRCDLPIGAAVLQTRALNPDIDLGALVEVNNRAFASHPDQGTLTVDSLRATMEESWFSAEGVRIFELDGRIAGFCWTKVHKYPLHPRTPDHGEIYVIAIDPDFHGRGLGVPMTASGLSWLADQGLPTAMLYVEADNSPAIRTYRRLGFTVTRTDKAWIRLVPTQ